MLMAFHRDGFGLNLGLEFWQYEQAQTALSYLRARPPPNGSNRPFKVFLSLDMNVLPSSTTEEADKLLEMILPLMSEDGYLRYKGGPLLSTFGGHEASLGGPSWEGWLEKLNERLGGKVCCL